jgi:hypothetical protein
MDFRAQYLQAMRERAPALFKRLSKDGELENQAAAMSEEAELMSRELTKDAPKDKNGLPLRIAGKPRRSAPVPREPGSLGYRLQAAWLALHLRVLTALDQEQKPRRPGGQT